MARLIGGVLYSIGLVLLLSLGTWQLSRGLNKSDIELKMQQRQSSVIVTDIPANMQSLSYQQVMLTGQWLERPLLLRDHRSFKSQLGFEVYQVFRLESGQHLLVNRGWVSHDHVDSLLQPLDKGCAVCNQISGRLYTAETGFYLGEVFEPSVYLDAVYDNDSGFLTFQAMDMSAIAQQIDLPLVEMVLALSAPHPYALQPIWQPYVVDATRHYGYAVQWYGLAVVFLIFGVIWWRHSRNHGNVA